jgi:hypothetical protein
MSSINKLVNILPGRVQVIDISSNTPPEIFQKLNNFDSACDTVLLKNYDVWRYMEYESAIFNHVNLTGRNVFLQYLGYTNHRISERHWKISFPFSYYIREPVILPIKQSALPFGYGCLNNIPAVHRVLLGYTLWRNNLLSQVIFSQNNNGPMDANIYNTLPDFESYRAILPIRWEYEKDIDNFYNDHGIAHPAFNDAYCNIITESEIAEILFSHEVDLPIISEKTIKAYRSCQIPMALACRGHVEYTRGLGFEPMEDFAPPGFDQMGVLEKIAAIAETVGRGREYAESYYFDHLQEIQHNVELVQSDQVDRLILNRIKDAIHN